MEEQQKASLVEIRNYFGMKSAEFTAQWGKLTATDKAQIRNGIGDGTENY